MIPKLKDNWLFRTLPYEYIVELEQKGFLKSMRYAKEATIHLAGTECSTIEIILSGSVHVEHIDANGNLLYITRLKKGGTIASVLLYASDSTYPFNVIAHEPTELLVIGKDQLSKLLQENFNVCEGFLNNLSNQTKVLTKAIYQLSEKTLRQKIIQFLEEEAEKQNAHTIVLPFSKKRLSEQIGVARTSLSRELQHMVQDGLILVDGKTITICF